jgi:hypothetical protein
MDVPEFAVEAVADSDWVMHDHGRWTVSPSHTDREVQVYSQLGTLCFEGFIGSDARNFEFATPSGTYLVVTTGPLGRSAHLVVVAH